MINNVFKYAKFCRNLASNMRLSQIASRRWADVGPTSALKLGRRWHYNVGSMSFCLVGQHRRRWANVGPTSPQRWGDIGPSFSQCWGDVGPTFGRRWANVFFANNLPTFWATFCQLLADLLPTFIC